MKAFPADTLRAQFPALSHGGSSIFFDNAVYLNQRSQLFRVELDGAFELVARLRNQTSRQGF